MKHIEILDAEGNLANAILADEAWAEAQYPGAWRLAASPPAPPPSDVRHITVGAFFDRFGSAKWAVLADESPRVRAVVRDASVRQWIDLDNPELPAGLALLQDAGHPVDPVAIVGTPVADHERP